MQYLARIRDGTNATGHAERNIDRPGHALHPAAIDAAPFWAGGDVIEHQLIGALIAIAQRQIDDFTHDHVIAKAHALDDIAVAHVQAGNDAATQHANASSSVKRPSSKARPRITPRAPATRAA